MQNQSQEFDLATKLYLEGRQLVVSAFSDTTQEALEWRGPNGESRLTIASQLLHLAGFDSMVRAAITGSDVHSLVSSPAWQKEFGAGFPRELGLDPPHDRQVGDLLAVLDEETEKTLESIQALDKKDVKSRDSVYFYLDGEEFKQEALVPYKLGMLILNLSVHDRYHRGQMAQMRYYFNQSSQRSGS